MRHLRGLGSFFRARFIPMLIFAAFFALIFNIFSVQLFQNDENARRTKLIEQIQTSQDNQTNDIKSLLTDNKSQQQLIVCLLQLHSVEGNFTDKEQCQQKVEEARLDQDLSNLTTGQTAQQQRDSLIVPFVAPPPPLTVDKHPKPPPDLKNCDKRKAC